MRGGNLTSLRPPEPGQQGTGQQYWPTWKKLKTKIEFKLKHAPYILYTSEANRSVHFRGHNA